MFLFFKQKTAYEMRISDWSSDVCSSDLPERFIIFCDDLSFEEGEPGYKALKSVLDGSVSASGENVLIYATSNRRHLMPEYMSENLSAKHQSEGEIHPGETVDEKLSQIGRASCWQGVCQVVSIPVAAVTLNKKQQST